MPVNGATCKKYWVSYSLWLLQTALASAEDELEDADPEVTDLPASDAPAAAAAAGGGDVEKSKKKRKANSDEGNGASGSKDVPASPQV